MDPTLFTLAVVTVAIGALHDAGGAAGRFSVAVAVAGLGGLEINRGHDEEGSNEEQRKLHVCLCKQIKT